MSTLFEKFQGIHTALITPFSNDQSIDLGALSEIIAQQKNDGIKGFVVAGTTGESPTLSTKEKLQLVSCVKESCQNKLALTVGAGTNSTAAAVELQKQLQDSDVDAVMHVVPYYNKPTQNGLIKHFSSIAKVATKPILLYNVPSRTACNLAPKSVETLALENDNILGIKDACTETSHLSQVISLTKKVRKDFLVLSGDDASFLSFLALGGDGIISVSSHLAAIEMKAIYEAFIRGDHHYASKVSRKINGFCDLLFRFSSPTPLKTILSHMNVIENNYRLPLCALEKHEEQEILQACKNYSFLHSFKQKGFLNE